MVGVWSALLGLLLVDWSKVVNPQSTVPVQSANNTFLCQIIK